MSHPCSCPPAKTGSTLSTTSVGVDIAIPTMGRTTVLLWEVSCLKRQSLRLRSAALGLTRRLCPSSDLDIPPRRGESAELIVIWEF